MAPEISAILAEPWEYPSTFLAMMKTKTNAMTDATGVNHMRSIKNTLL